MNEDTRAILCSPRLERIQAYGLRRLEAVYQGQTPPQPMQLCGLAGAGQCSMYDQPELWMDQALADLAAKAEAEKVADKAEGDPAGPFRPLTVDPWPYGVHFVDKLLGATVYEIEPGNWQAKTLSQPVGQLAPPDLDSHPAWQATRRLALAFVAADVSVPFYGVPVLSSALNIGLNLYGQELLVAMMIDPAAARRDLRIINDVIRQLHRWYLETIPAGRLQMVETVGRVQPGGYGQICGCSCQLLSPELYEEFIAALDDEVMSLHPAGAGLIHLCGTHTQHIACWRGLKSFKAFQLNDRAAEDFATYFARLRDDQVFYVSPTTTMTPERILSISGGKRVVLPSWSV